MLKKLSAWCTCLVYSISVGWREAQYLLHVSCYSISVDWREAQYLVHVSCLLNLCWLTWSSVPGACVLFTKSLLVDVKLSTWCMCLVYSISVGWCEAQYLVHVSCLLNLCWLTWSSVPGAYVLFTKSLFVDVELSTRSKRCSVPGAVSCLLNLCYLMWSPLPGPSGALYLVHVSCLFALCWLTWSSIPGPSGALYLVHVSCLLDLCWLKRSSVPGACVLFIWSLLVDMELSTCSKRRSVPGARVCLAALCCSRLCSLPGLSGFLYLVHVSLLAALCCRRRRSVPGPSGAQYLVHVSLLAALCCNRRRSVGWRFPGAAGQDAHKFTLNPQLIYITKEK